MKFTAVDGDGTTCEGEHQMTERISGYDPETDVCWQFRKQGRQGRVPDPPPPTGTKTGVGLAGPL